MSGKKAAVVQPPQVTPNNRPTQLPPAFTANTQLLLSRIPLPPNASISYRQFSVAPEALSPATLLEAARYRIVEEWTGENLFESFYPTVRLDSVEDIWVFAISSGKDNQLGRLLGFQPDGLIG